MRRKDLNDQTSPAPISLIALVAPTMFQPLGKTQPNKYGDIKNVLLVEP